MLTPLTYLLMLTLSTHISAMPRSRPAAPARPYHHGDLRGALIRSAIELLRAEGPDALTLRGVARAAGVSQAAPYRHFADRRALVAAVAEEGFRRMQSAMLEAVRSAPGALGFKGVAIAYVRFGHENPAEYRIMFGPELGNQDDLPELQITSRGVLEFVAEGVRGLQAAGLVVEGDAGMMAAALWSMLHGLVMLSLDGQTAGVTESLDALVETTTQLMMFGMAPRPAK
jgi:AcrR family transcriptional regulator